MRLGMMPSHHSINAGRAVMATQHPRTSSHPQNVSFSPQAAAPAALQDVPSVHRAASAKGPPPPSAAAASSSPRTALTGGQRGKLTLLYVFFLYVRSDSVSVRHVWCAMSCLNKAVCI